MAPDTPTIPGLRIESLLGEGGMGRVYTASRTTDGQAVALKVIRPRSGGNVPDSYRRRFLRESSVMRRLSHPGLPAFIDAGVTEDGLPWLAVELLEGTTLEDAPGFGSMDPTVLVPRLRHLLTAMAYLHGHGLVHRDVKPANVFLAGERTVLLDLGLVFVEEGTRLTATGDIAGTLSTMSPEQLRGEPATAATDLYQLGATAWMALHDAPPRESDALIALASLGPDPAPIVAATGHGGLDAFLGACLDADPGFRPRDAPTAALLLDAEAATGTVTTVTPAGRAGPRRPRPPGRRHSTSTVRASRVSAVDTRAPRRARRYLAPLVTLAVLGAILLPRFFAAPPPAPEPAAMTSAAPARPVPPTPAQEAMRQVERLWEDFLERHPGWTAQEEELQARALASPEADPSLEQALDLLEPLTGTSPGVDRLEYYQTLMQVLRALRSRRAHRTLMSITLPMMAELPRDAPAVRELLADACALATTSAREWRSPGLIRPVGAFAAIAARLAETETSPSWAALFTVFRAACLHFTNNRTKTDELRRLLTSVDPLDLPPAHRWRHPWIASRDAERHEQYDRARPIYVQGASLAPSAAIRVFFERREMEAKMEVMFGKPKGLSRNEEP